MPTRMRAGARAGGFSLLEMLVVMSLLAILTGIGVGFLQRRGDELEVAISIVRDEIRSAALVARTRHVPTEVRLVPGDQERPASVVANVTQPVAYWHMEAETAIDADGGVPSQVGGEPEPGRFGMARRHVLGSRAALLDAESGRRAVFDLSDGFRMRIDLLCDVAESMTVARLGTSLELRLDEFLVPDLRVVSTEGGGQPGPAVRLQGELPLRTRTWYTLSVVHDGRTLELLVNDQAVAAAPLALPILQTSEDRFTVSPAEEPVLGLVDSVAIEAYDRGEVRLLPYAVVLTSQPTVIQFDRNGDLVAPAWFEVAIDEDRREFRVGPGGVIE